MASELAKSIACCSEGVEGRGFRGGRVGVVRWDLLLPIGFITTDRSLLSGGDLCFYAMIVVCSWVLECYLRYEIQRAATPPGVPCGPGSSRSASQ